MVNIWHEDRLARAAGKPARTIPIIDPNPMASSALPIPKAHEWFAEWAKRTDWKNEVTVKT